MEKQKTSKFIPFDLKRAINGSKVVTQHGNEVKIGGYNPNAFDFHQVAVWISYADKFQLVGYNIHGTPSPIRGAYQLFMAETEQEERDRIHDEGVKKLVNDFFHPGEFIDPDDSLPWLDRKDAVGRRNGDVLAKTFREPQQCTEEQFKENMKKMERQGIKPYHEQEWTKYNGMNTSAPIHHYPKQYPEQYLADINMTLKEILNQLKKK